MSSPHPAYEPPPDSFFDDTPARPPGADVEAFQQDWSSSPAQATSTRHPIAVVFHLLFKFCALFVYIFAWLIADSFVVVFILCILFLVFDFWVVKNVTGRLLVGLRWWNEIKEDGSNEWIFESLEETSSINASESRIFWISMFAVPLLWVMFTIISILKLTQPEWFLLDIVAVVLSISNIVGYVKCARDARKKLKTMASAYITNAVVNGAVQQTLNRV